MYITAKRYWRKIQEIETEKEDIKEQFHQFKNYFSDEFNEFKSKFPHEVKSFKDNVLSTIPKNTGDQEKTITLLLDNITFSKTSCEKKTKL